MAGPAADGKRNELRVPAVDLLRKSYATKSSTGDELRVDPSARPIRTIKCLDAVEEI